MSVNHESSWWTNTDILIYKLSLNAIKKGDKIQQLQLLQVNTNHCFLLHKQGIKYLKANVNNSLHKDPHIAVL